MQTKLLSRFLSVLLVLALTAGLVPAAWAAGGVPSESGRGSSDWSLFPSARVDGVTLDRYSLSLEVGSHETLHATVSPSSAFAQDLSWYSSNTGVAEVSNGRVTALSPGEADITVTTDDGGFTASCHVIVTAAVPVTGVRLDRTELTLTKDGESATLKAMVSPPDAANQNGFWTVDDSGVISVDQSGKVTAVGNGVGTVTVTTADGGFTAYCTVRVQFPSAPPTLSLNKTSLSLTTGSSETLSATTAPEGTRVSWSSSNSKVASVDQSGKVTAVGTGTATITAIPEGGAGATCAVTVSDPSYLTLSKTELSVMFGKTSSLSVSNLPDGASVSWSADEKNIVSLSPSGTGNANCTVKGVTAGKSVTVTAVVTDRRGNRLAAPACTVTVTAASAPDITSSVASGGSVTFDESKFNSACTEVYGNKLNYVTFTLPSSSRGTLYYNYSNGTYDQKVSESTKYYYGGGVFKSALSKVSFVAEPDYSGKVTISYSAVDTSGYSYTGAVAPDITSSVASGGSVTFDESKFNSACTEVYGNKLNYVTFTLPSSSRGTLYYNYSNGTYDQKVSESTKYYYGGGVFKSALSKVSFVAEPDYSGKVTISYSAVDTSGYSYTGAVAITVSEPTGSIEFSGAQNEVIPFDAGDFNALSKEITGYGLDYVHFTLPSSGKGTLYYRYDNGDYDKKVSSSAAYYYDDSPYLEDVSFVPARNWSGTLTISFTARDTKRNTFSGTIEITVSRTADDIMYSVDRNGSVAFDAGDFNSFSKSATGSSLDYVEFTLPSSNKGTLYYNYDDGDYDEKVSSSKRYYRNQRPYLENITFVPARNYTGTVSIPFQGSSADSDSFSGTIRVTVGGGDSGDIEYSAAVNSPITLSSDDFNDYCKDETGKSLSYVQFTLPATSRGILYYGYDDGDYDKKVSASTEYFLSKSPYLEQVTFVPAKNYTGTVIIDFTGESTGGKAFSGSLLLSFATVKDPGVIYYTTDAQEVTFRSSDFSSACDKRGGAGLASVVFQLPPESAGRLYYNYGSPTSYGGLVDDDTAYEVDGSPSISRISFVPKAGFSGTVTIAYTGTDESGSTYTGYVQIGVTPSSSSSYFTDMGRYSWAAESVDYLYENGITTGVGATTYHPDGLITRGDFVLMLSRAFRFSVSGGDNFKDVPAESYYAQAISSAKALGIAQGGSDGRFNPSASLTREDAMVLLQRTLNRTGHGIDDASASYLNRFSDGKSVSSYAQGSVAALVQAGVIQGDDAGNLNPKGSLTRAEMAVILHRVLTL